MEDITLRCPDGYQLACMKASDEDGSFWCCVRVASYSGSSERWDLVSAP